jgi:hypothetical protein
VQELFEFAKVHPRFYLLFDTPESRSFESKMMKELAEKFRVKACRVLLEERSSPSDDERWLVAFPFDPHHIKRLSKRARISSPSHHDRETSTESRLLLTGAKIKFHDALYSQESVHYEGGWEKFAIDSCLSRAICIKHSEDDET